MSQERQPQQYNREQTVEMSGEHKEIDVNMSEEHKEVDELMQNNITQEQGNPEGNQQPPPPHNEAQQHLAPAEEGQFLKFDNNNLSSKHFAKYVFGRSKVVKDENGKDAVITENRVTEAMALADIS